MTSHRIALLVTTALILPAAAHAQSAETACADLEGRVVAGVPEELGNPEELTAIAAAGDGEACLVELTRITDATGGATVADTAETTVQLQDEVTVAGRVLLDRSAPVVDVQEGDTDVEIEPGAPTVTVTEPQADILVRQAAANVTIDMPVPTIRIEQPAPEIVITMPDPSVTVGAAQPQVRVVQADPVVTVTQAPPGVELELMPVEEGGEGGFDVSDSRSGQSYRAGDTPEPITTEDAEVNFTKSEPRVVMSEATEEAQVRIERAEPTVRFEQAEPTVEFTSAGEPQVEFSQSGEPVVTFEQAAAEGTEGATDAAALTGGAAAPTDPNAPADTAAAPEAAVQTPEQEEANEEAATAETAVDAPPAEGAQTAQTDTVETTAPVALEGPGVEREGYNLVQVGEYPVDTLVGTNLYGVNDEDIGEIGDLVLDADGSVTEVVVEIGGFLGIGEKTVRLPFERLSVLQSNAGDMRAYIDASQEELEAMPSE